MKINNNSKLLLSVIIPTFNCREKLLAHLDACDEWLSHVEEVIAIDSFSTDGTYELLEQRLKKVNGILIRVEKGLYQSWNKAISVAKYSYIYISTIGDIISKTELEELYYTAAFHNLDLVIGAPVIVDSIGSPINKKWPIHWIKEKAPIDFKILDESERVLLSSCFLPESIIGSSASNLYRREILVNSPFPVTCGNQGDVAWAIINIPKIRTALLLRDIGTFCWDGDRKNSWERLKIIVNNLSEVFDNSNQNNNQNNFIYDGFLCWLNKSTKRLYRSIYIADARSSKLLNTAKFYFASRRNLAQIISIPRKIAVVSFRMFSFVLKMCNTLRS